MGGTARIPSSVGGTGSAGRTLGPSTTGDDPRSAAARAAEARAVKSTGGTDKLSEQLAAQKKAGMKGALQAASEENRRTRDSDAQAEVRNYN